jgi:hypothetical protein
MKLSSHYANTDLHLSAPCLLGERSSLHGQHSTIGIVGITTFFPQNSTTPLHPESTEHNLERGVGPGSLGNVIGEHGVWSFILYPLALENRLISVRLML